MSLFIRFEILEFFVNTMTADDKYSYHCLETFAQPIQMHLPQKPQVFFRNI